jgi:hypothetical protein
VPHGADARAQVLVQQLVERRSAMHEWSIGVAWQGLNA